MNLPARRLLLIVVLLTAAFNLIPLAGEFWQDTYDGETHLFFADHYRRGWWDAWEEKWMQGFWVYSYPPLVHQLIALTGKVAGLETGYRLVQFATVLAYPVALWHLAGELFGAETADHAAVLSALPAGIYLALYSFGQLPTVAGIVLTLFALSMLARYLRTGGGWVLAAWAALVGAAFSAHHFTAIFALTPGALVIGLHAALRRGVRGADVWRRLALAGAAAAGAALLAIIPFWWWWLTQRGAVAEIAHPTRLPFFGMPEIRDLFFLRVYGVSLVVLPFALLWFVRGRARWPLAALMAGWFVIGLGGNTGVPRLLLGGLWTYLVYDRFSLLAAAFTPLAAADWMGQARDRIQRIAVPALLIPAVMITAGAAMATRNSGLLPPLQPWERTEMQRFLDAENHADWYYLTLGLGDNEFQHLSRRTSARTIDGYYTTARTRRELRESGIGSFDAAIYFAGGRDAVRSVLEQPAAWNVKWALVRDARFDPLLQEAGWRKAYPLGSDAAWRPGDPVHSAVAVWYFPGAVPVISRDAPPVPRALPILWGIVPLALLAIGVGLLVRPAA